MQTADPRPETSYAVAAAWGCLALGLACYPMVAAWAWLIPPIAIIAIALGRAARHGLKRDHNRERKVAAVGIVLAAIPLSLIILLIMLITVAVAISMITGVHCWGSCQP